MKHDLIFVPKIHFIISVLNINLTFLSSIDKFDLITILFFIDDNIQKHQLNNSTKMRGGVGYLIQT